MEKPDLSLVLPAYNEGAGLAETLSGIVKSLETELTTFEVIVVNNGSFDNTREILTELAQKNKRIVVVDLPRNLGYGGGILEGLKKAQGEVVGWSDADGQISPNDILRAYGAMVDGKAAAVKAVRVVRREELLRRIQSFFFNSLFALLFGGRTWDVNAKPKLMRRKIYESLALTNKKFFIDAEWVIKLTRLNIPIAKIAIEFSTRSHGKSNIRIWAALGFIRDMIIYRLGIH